MVDASKRIEQITFSYVVFLNPHPKFDLFSTNNPSYTRLNVPDYSFKGSIGFWQGVSNLTYTNWLIIDSKYSDCIGTCNSQCIGNIDCVNGKRGILQNRTCYICPAGTQADFKNKACSPICKAFLCPSMTRFLVLSCNYTPKNVFLSPAVFCGTEGIE